MSGKANMDIAMAYKSETHISELPLNTVIEIFKNLSHEDLMYSARLTCKLWYKLTFESVLWREIDISMFPSWTGFTHDTPFLKLLSQVQHSVEVLSVNLDKLSIKSLHHETIECTNLREIRLKVHVGEEWFGEVFDCLRQLTDKYPKLKSFSMSQSMNFFDYPVAEDEMGVLENNEETNKFLVNIFPNIESFSITGAQKQTYSDNLLLIFLMEHPYLQHITIKNCELTSYSLKALFTDMPQLQTIDLANSLDGFIFDEVIESFVDSISLPKLRKLILNNGKIDDKFLKYLVRQSRDLEHLGMNGMGFVTNIGLEYVAASCPNLRQFHFGPSLANITDTGIQRLVEKCHKLTILNLNFCAEISDTGVQAIAVNCPNLQKLCVLHCRAISDISMMAVAENCLNLRQVNVSYCSKLTGISFNALLTKCKHLKIIYADSCDRVSNLCLVSEEMIEGSLQKREEDVGSKRQEQCSVAGNGDIGAASHPSNSEENPEPDVEKVQTDTKMVKTDSQSETVTGSKPEAVKMNTDSQAEAVHDVDTPVSVLTTDQREDDTAKDNQRSTDIKSPDFQETTLDIYANHSHIKHLHLNSCAHLTDTCMKQISMYCKDLRVLSIAACSLITNAGVKEILRGCKFLRQLNISGSSRMSSPLTDDCLDDITQYGQEMHSLFILNNGNFTSKAVFNVVKKCAKIFSISVDNPSKGNSRLSKQGLIQLAGQVAEKTITLQFYDSQVLIRAYVNKELECKNVHQGLS